MTASGSDREDFLEAELTVLLGKHECPVCILANETEQAVLSWLATTNIREETTITKLVKARGLCRRHWGEVLRRRGGDLGASGSRVVSRIAEAAAADLGAGDVTRHSECPVCASIARREGSVLEMLFAALNEPHKLAAYRSSSGLCRPHLALAVEFAPEARSRQILIETQRRAFLALAKRLDGRATDAHNRPLAIRRAIALLVGGRCEEESTSNDHRSPTAKEEGMSSECERKTPPHLHRRE
jgi:hypothetical protein